MLDKEFDQYFRDRLLDHPSKVHLSTWKRVHTHLLQHKAFHFWKWYVVGPSAVVVAVTGHFFLAALHSTSNTTPKAAAVATYNTRPTTDSATTATATATTGYATPAAGSAATAATGSATSATGSAISTTGSATSATGSAVPASAATGSAAVTSTTAASASVVTPATGSATASTTLHPNPGTAPTPRNPASASNTHRGLHHIHSPDNTPDAYTPPRQTAGHTSGLASTHKHHLTGGAHTAAETDDETSSTGNETATGTTATRAAEGTATGTTSGTTAGTANRNSARPPVPAQLTAPAKLAVLKTPAVVAAKTPNAKKSHELTVPARPPRDNRNLHLDVFGGPEYYTWRPAAGISYSAGARVTLVFRNHLTVTTGLQYLRINVNHVNAKDSLGGLLPGYFTNIQIPLFLGYTSGTERFSFSVNAGVLYSLAFQGNGALKSADNWSNHDGLSFYIGTSFSTRVTDRISLFAEPYFKGWFPPGDQRLPAQLWSTGLSLGVRYNF